MSFRPSLRSLLPRLVTAGLALFAGGVGSTRLEAAENSPHANRDGILTLLETHCVKCHGGEKTKAGLDLTTREGLLRGGESGEAIVLGQAPDKSLVYRMVAHLEEPGMPHKE